jgi:hypothetical protein
MEKCSQNIVGNKSSGGEHHFAISISLVFVSAGVVVNKVANANIVTFAVEITVGLVDRGVTAANSTMRLCTDGLDYVFGGPRE